MSPKNVTAQGNKSNKPPNKASIPANSDSLRVSPSGSSGVHGRGAALPSTPLSKGAGSSQSSPINMLTSQFTQFKRASGPSPEFLNWTENQWFKKLCLVLESQNAIILSLQNENLANCANLHRQQQEITLLRDDIRNFKASQEQLQHDLNDLREKNNLMKTDEAIKKQEEALNKMTECISTLSAQRSVSQEEQDQQKLLDSVIVSSQDIPVEREGEKCVEIAQALIKNELQVIINKTDIIAAYRVGKKNPSGQNQRKIRLKLTSQSLKSHLVRSAASQRKGIYINECLTRKRQQLLYRLRQIRHQNPEAIHQCFVRDGLIKVRKTAEGKMFTITNEENLNTFLSQSVLGSRKTFEPSDVNNMATMAEEFESMAASPDALDLHRFRKVVRSYIERHHYKAAIFWADKVVSLSNGSPADVYWLAQSYFLTKQYHRAILLLNGHKLSKNPTCRYLMALCHYEVGEFHLALDLLEHNDNNSISRIKTEGEPFPVPEIDDTMSIDCSTHLLKGYIYEASDNRALAAESFRAAIQADPLCYEAIHALTQHHMLTVKEERDLLSSLPLSKTCSEPESAVVMAVYETRVNKYSCPSQPLPQPVGPLASNADFITAQAEKLYYNCNFAQCYRLTQEVLKKDPYHTGCLPIHVSCLVELKQSNTLFLLAHKLVDLYPESALAWFAVGCYYYLIGKNEQARRYLSKATALDRVFGPAWIAYGHSFAAENEHDQAMAAYFKAAQLMKGCHLPLLYIGMEYGLTNNPKFAEKFFKEALEIAPDDPFVLHELGVVASSNQEYTSAEVYLRRAVALVEESGVVVVPEKWAVLLNNLAHICRKLQKYEEALHFHQQALRLCPGVSSTYSALGLVQSLLGDYEAAVVALHKALSLHRDDTTATTLLTTVMEQLMTQTPAFQGDDNVPQLDLPSELVGTDTNTSDITPACAEDPLSDTNLLGSSIGQPVMHSSDVGGDSLSHSESQSSALIIEDMVMDDQSP